MPSASKPIPQSIQSPASKLFKQDWLEEVGRLLDTQRFAEARSLCNRRLKLSDQNGDLKGQAQAHYGLGLVAWARGDLQNALNAFEASLSFWQRPGVKEPAQQANTFFKIGEVLLAIGQPHDAIATFNEGRKLLRRDDPAELRFQILSGTGMAHFDLGDWRKAIFFYRLALDIAETSEDKALALHRLGTAFRLQGDRSEAEVTLRKARQIARTGEAHRVEAYAIADLAHMADLAGREQEALRGFEQARQVFLDLEINLYVASTLLGTAETYRDLGQLDKAIASIEQAIELVEPVRSNLEKPEDRVGFFAARHRYYDLYIELLMEQARRRPGEGYEIRAFEASERSKARSLLDDMAAESDPAMLGTSLNQIQARLLDRDSLLLAYSLGERGSFLWVVKSTSLSVFNLPPRAQVEAQASLAWSGLSQGRGRSDVGKLSQMLLPAGIGLRSGERLLVSPDGLLHLIPFTLLKGRGDRMLLLDHEIAHVPSASVVLGMRQKLAARGLAPMRFAGFGDPVFRIDDKRLGGLGEPTGAGERGMEAMISELARLDYSDDEIEDIYSLFPEGQRFKALGFKANLETVLEGSGLGRFQILHFATHHLAGGHPTFTGLVLSRFDERGHPQRGFLTAPEIYDLRLPAELVVLSACGTGLGQNVRGEGPVGLTRAFLHAGARRVVVSLWSVNDHVTAELMRRFYFQMLHNKLSPAAALREAQISMAQDEDFRQKFTSWGAFVVQGEPH